MWRHARTPVRVVEALRGKRNTMYLVHSVCACAKCILSTVDGNPLLLDRPVRCYECPAQQIGHKPHHATLL